MSTSPTTIGVQQNGSSPFHVKAMATRAFESAARGMRIAAAADIGGGRGEWARQLSPYADSVFLLDYAPPLASELPINVEPVQTDLNAAWPLLSESIDFAFALEVIEHVENPRHFFRELARVTRTGGRAYLSTPNNHSLASKLTFLIRGQHRFFQEPSYPAHITPLLESDFQRLASESGLEIEQFLWSDYDTLPLLHWQLPFRGRWFSDCMGVILRKPEGISA